MGTSNIPDNLRGGHSAEDPTRVIRSAGKMQASTTQSIRNALRPTPPDPVLDALRTWEKQDCDPEAGPTFRIGHHSYTLIKKLGEGGLGTVYLAHLEEEPDEQVAVKIITVDTGNGEHSTIARADSGEMEGNALEQAGELFDKTHVDIPATGKSFAKRHHLLAMRHHPGISLQAWLQQKTGPIPPLEACQIMLQLAEELQKMSARLILHHDVKASNVMVSPDGTAKWIDWGAATFVEQDDTQPQSISQFTPASSAPEQLEEQKSSMQAQVFSLGLMLLRLLAAHKLEDPLTAAGVQEQANPREECAQIREALVRAHPQNVQDGSGLYGILNTEQHGEDQSYLYRATDWKGARDAGQLLHTAFQKILHLDPTKRMTIEELIAALNKVIQELKRK